MKVTLVSIRPTPEADAAGRPSLTPELLAASGARYSRSAEGLESIISRIDPENPSKSVDGIFRMIDYGHQSIADMAPVSMFIDGISMWLAYLVWTVVPTAGGQESSTRYIKLGREELVDPDAIGIPASLQSAWTDQMVSSIDAYEKALDLWRAYGDQHPEKTRIPTELLNDTSEKAQKQVMRMKRNYGFDRARYFLPAALRTNMMLIMSARGWVQLCQFLLSHPLPEANRLGALAASELELSAPRLLRHAVEKASFKAGLKGELCAALEALKTNRVSAAEAAPNAFLEAFPAGGNQAESLQHHDNRYAYFGPALTRTAVRFGVEAAALAEIRDLNRHRTGTKYCPAVPLGFYSALDESGGDPVLAELETLTKLIGEGTAALIHQMAAMESPAYVYGTLLGHQYRFEHTTTADKFIYEAELRTGTGAHYRYAKHLRDCLQLWYEKFPETKGLVLEGSAEPE